MRAGVPEAAAAYANAVFPGDLTPSQRQEVADALSIYRSEGLEPTKFG